VDDICQLNESNTVQMGVTATRGWCTIRCTDTELAWRWQQKKSVDRDSANVKTASSRCCRLPDCLHGS